MLGRFARWLAVVLTAWALRRGAAETDMLDAVGRAYPKHDSVWHMAVINDAIERNARKMADAAA